MVIIRIGNFDYRFDIEISQTCIGKKKFLQLRRDRDAGRLNKHTMRKLYAIYSEYIVYKNDI